MAFEVDGLRGAQIAMNSKSLIMIGLVVGSTLGGCVPSLWGDGGLSNGFRSNRSDRRIPRYMGRIQDFPRLMPGGHHAQRMVMTGRALSAGADEESPTSSRPWRSRGRAIPTPVPTTMLATTSVK